MMEPNIAVEACNFYVIRKQRCCLTDLLKQILVIGCFLGKTERKNHKISVMRTDVPRRGSKPTRHGCGSILLPSQLARLSYRLYTWESRLTSTRSMVHVIVQSKPHEMSAVRQVLPVWHMSLSVPHSGTCQSAIDSQSTPCNCCLLL
jgi:hypothetical protein